ncbi:hypothetical protein HF563_08215 [Acidithiobacillus ferridurans]|uniref:hypothetical protein n=1 Tax=Acidithiobacillus ferridurans TaxID=1232575 RepID=UPI001C078525|nr:hypothetical protein [Acidithiobacillus ferridurans]MBU2719357.1 hypothetical protein [Acidithiobacillus ferridurans]MBU2733467.1 hypothetical protein [Acidithiobacillus ferridurans]
MVIAGIKIPAASCGVFPQPLFARFRCKQRGIRPEEIEQLDVIRMMVKPDSEPHVRAVRSAVYGLLIARLPVTDGNVKWLLRDKQLGFGEIDHFENAMALYPAMNEYKGKLKDIYDSYHPHEK